MTNNPSPFCDSVADHTIKFPLPVLFSANEAVSVKQAVQELFQVNAGQVQLLLLDFTNTTFMDSSGIGALVNCRKLTEAEGAKLRLINVPTQVRMVLSLTNLDEVFDIEALTVNPEAGSQSDIITHPSMKSKAKRVLDILGAIVGLGITALIFVPIAVLIKLEDGGPIFFGQMRCSWLGKKFRMWKFRSMVTNAEAIKHTIENKMSGALFKNPDDPRITRIGKFLRRTSLDEFPQFWNVLRGDMSLVGTRPPTPDEIDRYEILQWRRLDIKPGMTGEWQVHGRSQVTNFEQVVELDMRYQENWSFWYDIQLIIKTVTILFNKNSGAY
ncbi:MAG: sugar transferase [Prochlorotrichaceae cyanobacterium]